MSKYPTQYNQALGGWTFGPGVPAPRLPYRIGRIFFRMSLGTFWHLRIINRHYEPTSGSALYISNHQSFLDPPLMSLALRRPMNYMARDSLFHNPLFRLMISSVNAFPVKRSTADTGALKEALRRLKAGGQLVLFPEGTRTTDGRVGEFLPGVAMLAQRAADCVIPTVIEGAFESWPKTRPFPLPGRVLVMYAKPMPREQVQEMKGDELIAVVRGKIIQMQAELRRIMGKPELKY